MLRGDQENQLAEVGVGWNLVGLGFEVINLNTLAVLISKTRFQSILLRPITSISITSFRVLYIYG